MESDDEYESANENEIITLRVTKKNKKQYLNEIPSNVIVLYLDDFR
jgi:hypothetical protein